MMVDADAKTRLSESKPDPLVGRTLDGYKVEEVIGRGGMGTVYRATQLSLGRPVALKVLTSDLATDPQFLERFHREADILSRLSHPNIVTVFERGEVDGQPYLVMEFVEGGTSLRDVVRRGQLDPGEALRVVSSVLSALQHAHEKGIVHRDIKPENVLLARGDIVKVADFGLSRLLDLDQTRLTRTHLVLGTYEYMAPEQREHAREADERSDLYATGVVLYEMLTGELPIGRFELPSGKRPKECDRRIDILIERSLDKDPAHRYQAASEMADAVSAILEHPSAPDLDLPPHRPAASDSSMGEAYRPVRLEYHVDNLATVDHVLGTACYVLGFLSLFGAGFMRSWFGINFILFFVGGWYLRETAENLRKFKHAARTAQAVIAVICAFTVILIPFSLYSFWVLFGHRGRTYYEARARKLSPREAASYTYRLLEEPYGSVATAPAHAASPPPRTPPPPPAPPRTPSPSQIPVQSMVTSQVVPAAAAPRRLSPFTKAGLLIIGLSLIAGGISIAADEVIDMDFGMAPLIIGGILLAIGMLHAMFSRTTRGAWLAAFAIGAAIAGGVVYEEEYAQPIKRARWQGQIQSRTAKFQVGAYKKPPRNSRYEYEFMRDTARIAWLQVATRFPGNFGREVRLQRSGNLLVVQFPVRYMHNRQLINDIAYGLAVCIKMDLGEDFLSIEGYTVTKRIETFVKENPPPE